MIQSNNFDKSYFKDKDIKIVTLSAAVKAIHSKHKQNKNVIKP